VVRLRETVRPEGFACNGPRLPADWFRQAEADLRHARNAAADRDFEWSAFAAQQSAEKAIKALFQKLHLDAWGHTLSPLLASLPEPARPEEALIDVAKALDKHYIPTRHPNGFERGAPTDFYTRDEAERAIGQAEQILEFCRRQIDR
jgi:HEPN domain-containing protein